MLDLRFGRCDLAQGSASLLCFFCAEDGGIVLEQRLDFKKAGARASVIVPDRARTLCFALRLAGHGMIAGPHIAVRCKKAVNESASAQDSIDRLTGERRYRAAISLIESLPARGERDYLSLLKCHTSLHEFDRVIAVYEALPAKIQMNASARIHYLRALANVNDTHKARALIESHTDVDFLTAAYPFATYLGVMPAQQVRSRIVSARASLKKTHINHALRCAHDLITERRFEESAQICESLQAMALSREDQAKMHILDAQRFYVRGDATGKLNALNQSLACFGLAPIALADPAIIFTHDNIACPSIRPRSVRGPLVSVMMTAYNSAETVEYALRSIMNQTYADLEIIVADDLSRDDTREKVARLAEKDPRIRLIALPRNGGTYAAKNQALHVAQGDYITCHDSDDWAHPQKIERTLAALQAEPSLAGAAAQHVRYHPKRGFRGRNGYIQHDAPSLMYRRKEVMEKIGYYDAVRAGADTEHQYRIERAFGRRAIKFLPDFLTLFLWSETSLTGGGVFAIDDDAGIFSKPRSLYRQAYMQWHETTDHYYYKFPAERRAFAIPPEMEP